MNWTLDTLTALFWTQVWQMTVLIPLAIGAVRLFCRRRAHLAYLILLAVLLKCMIPPIWSSPVGVFSWTSYAIGIDTQTPVRMPDLEPSHSTNTVSKQHTGTPLSPVPQQQALPAQATETAPVSSKTGPLMKEVPAKSSLSLRAILIGCGLGLWVCGVVGFVGYLIAKRLYLDRFHDDTRLEVEEDLLGLVWECSIALDLRRRPDLIVTRHPTIPFIVGWLTPRLVLPQQIVEKSSPEDIRLIIAHELNHLRRWDTVVNWVQLVVQSCWWFHPMIWWLNLEIRRWRESCCDEEVVARLQCPPSQYANCLLNVLELQSSLRATSGLSSLSPMEVTRQRLLNIMQPLDRLSRSTPWTGRVGFLVMLLLILPGAAFRSAPADVVVSKEAVRSATLEPKPEPVIDPIPLGNLPKKLEPWEYRFDPQRIYQYQITIRAETPTSVRTFRGSPTIQRVPEVLAAESLSSTLRFTNWDLIESGSPTRTRFSPFGFEPPRYHGPFEGSFLVKVNSQGGVIEESDDVLSVPLLMERWPDFLLAFCGQESGVERTGEASLVLPSPDIPDDPVSEFFPFPSRFGRGPYGQPSTSKKRLAAEFREKSNITRQGETLRLERTRNLMSRDLVEGEPRLEVRSTLTWEFDQSIGLPLSIAGKATQIERSATQINKLPIEVSVQLMTAEEQVQVAKQAAEAMAAQDPLAGPAPITNPGREVGSSEALSPKQVVLVLWGQSWFPAEIVEVIGVNEFKVHYRGWSDSSDEVVPLNRLRHPPGSNP